MEEIVKGVNWNILGPVLVGLIVILGLVFGFILKLYRMMIKMFKENDTHSIASAESTDGVILKKETFDRLFNHESRLSSTETKVKTLCTKFDDHSGKNNKAFKRVFNKLDLIRDLVLQDNPGFEGQDQSDNVKEAVEGTDLKVESLKNVKEMKERPGRK